MFNQIVKSVSDNPAVATAIGSGIAYVASEVIGASPLKANGLLHLLFNILHGIYEASTKKEGK